MTSDTIAGLERTLEHARATSTRTDAYLWIDANECVGARVELFFERDDDALKFGGGLFANEISYFANVGVVEGSVDFVE